MSSYHIQVSEDRKRQEAFSMGLVMGAGYDNNNGSTIPPLPNSTNMGTPILATPMNNHGVGGTSSSSSSYQPQSYAQLPLPSSQHGMTNYHLRNQPGSSMYVNTTPMPTITTANPIHSLSTPYFQSNQSTPSIPLFLSTATAAGAYGHQSYPSNNNHNHHHNVYASNSNTFGLAANNISVGTTSHTLFHTRKCLWLTYTSVHTHFFTCSFVFAHLTILQLSEHNRPTKDFRNH